jgi:putative methyltransferase (TIGR04325 family)
MLRVVLRHPDANEISSLIPSSDRSQSAEFSVWEGIYATFAEVPGSSAVFSEALWVERSRQKAIELREREGGIRDSIEAAGHEYCVPVIAAMLQAERGHVRILDFGGSVGLSFSVMTARLARPDAVEVHVVDNERICVAGRDVFRDEPRISFHTSPPDLAFDLVHLGSSVQYVPDWIETVERLVLSRPRYLVFDDLPAGAVQTFVAAQNYYGKRIPHWFFNLGEFVRTVSEVTGYELIYRAPYLGTFLGKRRPFPMENFPVERRIDSAYNLAFVRRGPNAR